MKTINQVIVNDAGHSWLGFHTIDNEFNKSLSEILKVSKQSEYKTGSYKNAFWVLDKDGSCVAAQSSLNGAMKYYNNDRILVHTQKHFFGVYAITENGFSMKDDKVSVPACEIVATSFLEASEILSDFLSTKEKPVCMELLTPMERINFD